MLKKAKTRLLTRAAQNRDCVFRGAYRAATVREPVPYGLFQQPPKLSVRHKVSEGAMEKLIVSALVHDEKDFRGLVQETHVPKSCKATSPDCGPDSVVLCGEGAPLAMASSPSALHCSQAAIASRARAKNRAHPSMAGIILRMQDSPDNMMT
jgi:hypothetical protein